MTTAAAAAAGYLSQHEQEHADRPMAIYNPQDKPAKDLPVIYGFNNGGTPGWYSAILLAEDGTPLGEHLCSDEGYMPHDLGMLEGARPDRHEGFKKHYPDGYRMEFVSYGDVRGHPGLMAAIEKANAKQASDDSAI